ncbi:hypothetical protein EDC01DRAFT_761391 [Geopyxis carbonaria]|nr:hypothetical protein EDC01DRAFT_761391 [Geopyxis carbonaria]
MPLPPPLQPPFSPSPAIIELATQKRNSRRERLGLPPSPVHEQPPSSSPSSPRTSPPPPPPPPPTPPKQEQQQGRLRGTYAMSAMRATAGAKLKLSPSRSAQDKMHSQPWPGMRITRTPPQKQPPPRKKSSGSNQQGTVPPPTATPTTTTTTTKTTVTDIPSPTRQQSRAREDREREVRREKTTKVRMWMRGLDEEKGRWG